MQVGDTNEIKREVTPDLTAREFGSGGVEAFGTPAMVAFMEEAALSMIDPQLDKNETTVGISVNIRHLAPTPVGDEVTVKATLDKIEGKKLSFTVEAYDSQNKIGEGTHERFIVNIYKFMSTMQRR